MVKNSHTFDCRIDFIDGVIAKRIVWVFELYPPYGSTSRSATEWIEEHLDSWHVFDYREKFGITLSEDEDFQLLFRGKLTGRWCLDEWDEEVEILEHSCAYLGSTKIL